MKDFLKAKEVLLSGEYTCVLCKGEDLLVTKKRGVRPLVAYLESGADYTGYSAADKVVGKATAFLYAKMSVCRVYAKVISKSALDVLQRYGIEVEYATLSPYIVNRQGDGMCPFEEAVLLIEDKEKAYETIVKKLQEI